MGTSFSHIIDAFYLKLERDADFFSYYNLTEEQSREIALQRATAYLIESISIVALYCDADVDFNEYDSSSASFDFDLTSIEINMLASIMFEVHLSKDVARLKVDKNYLPTSDLKILHSPANERRTFLELLEKVKRENRTLLSNYASRDRITGKRKLIDHDQYDE